MQSYEREGRNDEERKGGKRRKDGSKAKQSKKEGGGRGEGGTAKKTDGFLRRVKLDGKLGRNKLGLASPYGAMADSDHTMLELTTLAVSFSPTARRCS